MSFILDALKKSENERQRHQGPSLVDVRARRTASERPWWVFVLAGLLALNLIVFAVVLLRKDDQPTAAASTTPAAVLPVPSEAAPPAPRPATKPAPRAQPPAPEAQRDLTVRSLAEEAGVEDSGDAATAPDPTLAGAADAPAGPPIVSPIRGPNAAPVRLPPPARSEENLPTLNDVTATGAAQLPTMHLDIHVYATTPAERFVFINMKKYHEGETTAEGMTVEQIRRDGVVLNHQGMRFVLPRH